MNSSPNPYLNVTRSRVHPAGDEDDLLVLDVHTFHRADAGRELEHLEFAEGLGGEPTPVALPDDGRV